MHISKHIMSFLVLGKPEGGKSKSKSGDKPEGGKSKSKSGDKPKEGPYIYTSMLIKNTFLNEYF